MWKRRVVLHAGARVVKTRALLAFLDEMDAWLGPPTDSELAWADGLLNSIFGSVEQSGVF